MYVYLSYKGCIRNTFIKHISLDKYLYHEKARLCSFPFPWLRQKYKHIVESLIKRS